MSTFLVSGSFWAQTIERAVKTFAQAAIALLTGQGLGLLDVDWRHVISVAGLAAVVSVLTSIGSGPFGQNSPSLVSRREAATPAADKLVPQPAPEPTPAATPAAATVADPGPAVAPAPAAAGK